MALTPKNELSREEKLAARKSAEEEALLREVDDAVRHDDLAGFAARYGKPLVGLLIVGLGAFGGYLWWDDQRETALETTSEELVKALDQLEAGNLDTADTALAPIAEGEGGAAALAKMQRAGIAMQRGDIAAAVTLFDEVAGDESVSATLREAAAIRSVNANFDNLDPQQVIDRLKPYATPGNPWFGSAGELVAMAYLEQDKPELAGPLFAEISKADNVPDTLRSRMRQMAGYLGVDAIEDIDEIIGDATVSDGEPALPQE